MAECPWEALRSNLPDGAKTVLTALWQVSDPESMPYVWIERSELAGMVGMTTRTLRRRLTTLREQGWAGDAADGSGRRGFYLCVSPGTAAPAKKPRRSGAADARRAQRQLIALRAVADLLAEVIDDG